jgi:hypothetical protein
VTSNGHYKVAGIPGAGKSGLVISLSFALAARGISCGVEEIDPYSDTHDIIRGLKPESQRQRLTTATMADIEPRLERFERCSGKIVLGDLSGWLGGDNLMPHVLYPGDAVILVVRQPLPGDKNSNHDWEQLLAAKGVRVAARVQSWHPGQVRMSDVDVVVEGLTREISQDAPGIAELAERLIALSLPNR